MRKPPPEVSTISAPLEGLRLQIKRTEAELIARQSNDEGNGDEMAVLFTGNWHDSVPRRLILDASMTPTERLLWMVIRSTIGDASRPGSVPRRAELARLAGCSNTTITTSREVLRINRWTTHCRTVRSKGRFVGDIYLLHDEPLSLASTLELDPGYIEFLERLVNGSSKTTRVRQLAANILREIDAMNSPVVPPTETEVLSKRIFHFALGAGAAGILIEGSAHQEQNLTPVKASVSPQVPLFSDLGKTHRQIKSSPRHQEQILTPVPTDQKTSQEQNLTLVQNSGPLVRNSSNSGDFLAEIHQGEKLTPVVDGESDQGEKLTPVVDGESDQGEFLTPVVISSLSFSSSSFKNKNINAHTREAIKKSPEAEKKTLDSLQRANVSGALETLTAAKTAQTPLSSKSREQLDDELYDEEPNLPDLMSLQQLILRHLPDISNPCLEVYQRVLLATRQAQIPQLARVLRPLPKNQRRNVLFQLLGKAASDWHGWSVRPLGNVVAYCKTLADLAAGEGLKLDDYALELMRCADSNRKPYFESTIDRQAELSQMDRAVRGVKEGIE